MNGKRSEKKTNNKHANQMSGTTVRSIMQEFRRQMKHNDHFKPNTHRLFDTGSLAARFAGGELALACACL